MLHLYLITDGPLSHWYAAESPEEAERLFLDDAGLLADEKGYAGYAVTQLPDDQKVTLADPFAGVPTVETRRAREWCHSKGFVASTEF